MSAAARTFEVSSVVAATPAEVWARVTTMAGVNAELMPFARMTFPARVAAIAPENVVPGERLFRSWILLLGILPVDYDDVTFASVTPGVGFHECSPMLSQRRWVHERTLAAAPGGCRVTDRITFEPRVAWLAPVYLPIFRAFFGHRHRRLRRAFAR